MTAAPDWVLDTGALMAFASGVETVGHLLADAADVEVTVAIPLVCLIEAYSLVEYRDHDFLRLVRRNTATRTVMPTFDPNAADDCQIIGDMARRAGRLGAGHAAFVALANAASVVTSRADQIHAVLGPEWHVVEV